MEIPIGKYIIQLRQAHLLLIHHLLPYFSINHKLFLSSSRVDAFLYSHFWYLYLIRFTLPAKVMPGPRPRTVQRRIQRGCIQRRVRTARNSPVSHRPLDIRHGDGDRSAVGIQHARGLTQFSVVKGLQIKRESK